MCFGASGGKTFGISVCATGLERDVVQQLCFHFLLLVVGNMLFPTLNRLVEHEDRIGFNFIVIRREVNLVAWTIECVFKVVVTKHRVVVAATKVRVVGRELRNIVICLCTIG